MYLSTSPQLYVITYLFQAFKEVNPIDIGLLQIPKKYLSKEDKPGIVNLELTMKNLQNLIEKISF